MCIDPTSKLNQDSGGVANTHTNIVTIAPEAKAANVAVGPVLIRRVRQDTKVELYVSEDSIPKGATASKKGDLPYTANADVPLDFNQWAYVVRGFVTLNNAAGKPAEVEIIHIPRC